jgi:Uma2 family endonuclease
MSLTFTTRDEEAIEIPSGIDTLSGFRRWAFSPRFPQRGRISFLDGVVEIDMSPEEIGSHGTLKEALTTAISNFARDRDLGRVFPDGTLLVNEQANIANEPDVMFCTWQTMLSKRVEICQSAPGNDRWMELRGSPDVVVEILSRSSMRKDRTILREKYFDAGIREYWLIDARGEKIDFELLVRGSSRFRSTRPGKDGSHLSGVFQRRVKIGRQRDRVGLWLYEIEWIDPVA